MKQQLICIATKNAIANRQWQKGNCCNNKMLPHTIQMLPNQILIMNTTTTAMTFFFEMDGPKDGFISYCKILVWSLILFYYLSVCLSVCSFVCLSAVYFSILLAFWPFMEFCVFIEVVLAKKKKQKAIHPSSILPAIAALRNSWNLLMVLRKCETIYLFLENVYVNLK